MATHIDLAERRAIERARKKGKGVNEIARLRRRSKSTISEEIRMGTKDGVYQAAYANEQAKKRRRQAKQKCLKVAMDPKLKAYVTQEITAEQTPEAISGRLKEYHTHLPYASPKAIYHFVYSSHGGPLEHHLYSRRVKRKGGPKRGSKRPSDTTKHLITERPAYIQEREEFGHYEGDFIVSGKHGTHALLVLVERKTRRVFIVRVRDRSAKAVNALIGTLLMGMPILSITLDNDISFVKHEELSQLINATVYFTRPYTSQDKGSVENRNKGIRAFVPKGCDISQVPDETISRAEAHLNTRYMKCLAWRTPLEAWSIEMIKWQRKHARARVQKNARCAGDILAK
jgi:IS30 family transposase